MHKIKFIVIIEILLVIVSFKLYNPIAEASFFNDSPDNNILTSSLYILDQNVTRTFKDLGITCQLVSTHIGMSEIKGKGILQSHIPAGQIIITLHVIYNATMKGQFAPVPLYGYQCSIDIANKSLGSTNFKPSSSNSQYKSNSIVTSYQEDIPEVAEIVLTVSALFQAIEPGERANFIVLPISTLEIIPRPPESRVTNPTQSNGSVDTEEMTVGPVVLKPLEAWVATDRGDFIIKSGVLCGMLGITINFLRRRKQITDNAGASFIQLMLEELENDDMFEGEDSGLGGII